MPRAALYCRLSEEDRNKRSPGDDSLSIRNQKAMLTSYCAEKDWQVYDIYSDDDYTGSDRNRPEFQRLLADARQRKFDIVLCKTQSRFTREIELVERYIHGLFPRLGIRFVSIVDNADTAAPGNKKARQINGLVNEWYLEDLSENIRSVLTSRRRDGFHIGSFALYGYRKDPEHKGHLLVDEEAAAVVREVFSLYASGRGMTAIARTLNDRGVPNPTVYKQRQGLRYRQPSGTGGGLWTYSAVSSLLRNEMYAGTLVQGKCGSVSYKTRENRPRPREEWLRVPGTHEAIVPPELWAQVQAQLASRARPRATGELGLFAGTVYCAGCGHALRSSKSHGRRYLHCPTHRLAKDACPGAFLSVDALEETVRQELLAVTARHLNLSELERQSAERRHAAALEQLERERLSLVRQRDHCAAARRALYLDKANHLLSEEDYLAFSGEFQAEMEQIAARLEELEQQREALDNAPAPEQSPAPLPLTRELVQTFIRRIEVSRPAPDSKAIPVTVFWRF